MDTNREENPKGNSKQSLAGWLLAVLAIIFIALTYALYIPRVKNGVRYFKNIYPFLNPSVALVDHDDLVVNFQPLRQSLVQKYESRDDYLISIYFEYLPAGANIAVNKDARIWPASLIKVPVALAAMKKVERGDWKMTDEVPILNEDRDIEFGNLYQRLTGSTVTVRDLFREALVNSDNTAHFMFLRKLDLADLEEVYSHLGLEDILEALKKAPRDVEVDNRITAKNYTVFFRSLYNATFLSPEYSQLFLDILKDAPAEYARAGIPEDVVFAHKTGIRVDKEVWTDSGIVYLPGRPYLLTVMAQKKDGVMPTNEEIDKLFADISREIYDYVSEAR